MAELVAIHRGAYHDSVSLMQLSSALQRDARVEAAVVAMGTDLNRGLLEELGFDPGDASSTDLVVAVRTPEATDPETIAAAALAVLSDRTPAGGTATLPTPPRSIRRAALDAGDATVALVSVPGPHAFTEAMAALDAGLDVVLFSDNVSIDSETALKQAAADRGRIVMGPDCGTVILGGSGLGFANVVRPGPVGLVAASGTGAQQICALLDAADVGMTHVVGTGGRDLSAEVGATSTLAALSLLEDDPTTELVAVIAKSADPGVVALIDKRVETMTTPTLVLVGAPSLEAAAASIVERVGQSSGGLQPPMWPGVAVDPRVGDLRCYYAGGTLAAEARSLATAEGITTITNLESATAAPSGVTDGSLDPATTGDVVFDFGADDLTNGRPHPMIDGRLRNQAVATAAADPDVSAIVLDVVLGHGAASDPASELTEPIHDAVTRGVLVSVALIGTRDDPQDRARQADVLAGAGAHVHVSNRQAVALACAHVLEGRA